MKRGSTWTYVPYLGRDASGKKQQKWVGGRDFADNTIDAFGDAYEYLMTMYASSAGHHDRDRAPTVGTRRPSQRVRVNGAVGTQGSRCGQGSSPRTRTAGLTQRELASRMGASQAAIAHVDAAGVGATPTTLQKVATALNLDVAVLLRRRADGVSWFVSDT
jgi:hypothetical protein